jgi:hypothetical protein
MVSPFTLLHWQEAGTAPVSRISLFLFFHFSFSQDKARFP